MSRSRWRRRAAWLAAALVALPALLLAAAATEVGTRWLIDAGSALAGGSVRVGTTSGSLIGGLVATDVDARFEDVHVEVGRGAVRWRPLALLAGEIRLETVALRDVVATVSGPAGGAIVLPLPVDLHDLTVDALSIRGADGRHDVARIEASARIDRGTLTVRRLRLRAGAVALHASGSIALDAPYALDLGLSWNLHDNAGMDVDGSGRVRGDARGLHVRQRLTAPFPAQIEGTIAPAGAGPRLDLHATWRDARWPLGGTARWRSPRGGFRLRGTPADLEIRLDTDAPVAGTPLERLRLAAHGRIDPRPPYPFDLRFDWSAALHALGAGRGHGHLAGDATHVDVDHVLAAPFDLTTRGSVALGGPAPAISLAGEWKDLRWPLAAAPAARSRHGEYAITGSEARLRVHLRGDLTTPDLAASEIVADLSTASPVPGSARAVALEWRASLASGTDAAGSGRLTIEGTRVDFDQHLAAPFAASARGHVDLAGATPVLAVRGDWRNLRWPLAGTVRVLSPAGRFRVHGRIGALAVATDASVRGAGLPDVEAEVAGTLGTHSVEGLAATLHTLGGEVRVAGGVRWSPAPGWDLRVRARDLDPGRRWPGWHGRVDGSASVSGTLGRAGPDVRVGVDALEGTMRGFPLHGSGSLHYRAGAFDARAFELASGPNRVRVNGRIDDRLALAFDVDAPALADVWPGLGGRIRGHGKLSGTRADPNVEVTLAGSALRWQGTGIDRLSLEGHVESAGARSSRVDVAVSGLTVAGGSVQQATLAVTGNARRHAVKLDARSSGRVLSADARGSWDGKRWQGEIEALGIEAPGLGSWHLATPVGVAAGADGGHVDRLCLQKKPGRACVVAHWTAGGNVAANGSVEHVPLALLEPWLPRHATLVGALDGSFRVRTEGGVARGTLEIVPTPGEIRVAAVEPGGAPLRIPFRDARLVATADARGMDATLGLTIADNGRVEGRAHAGVPDPRGARPLRGDLHMNLPDLALLRGLAPGLSDERGRVEASLTLAGTTAAPDVHGRAALLDGAARVLDPGIELHDASLVVESTGGGSVHFTGSMRSGKGRLDVEGEARLDPAQGWPTSLHVHGKDFEIARLPNVQVVVSPDLRARSRGMHVDVTGRIDVPRARIRLHELPATAVQVSRDEVVVGAGKSAPPAGAAPTVTANVEVALGKDVRFEGFGVSGGLTGRLAIRSTTGRVPLGQGNLSVTNGSYQAYGQKLVIERGRLIFAGPVDDPGLDIRASRTVGDVTTGIEIGGTARAVHSKLYSTPALTEAESLSYLLTGHALSGASKSDAGALAQAAVALGLEHSQLVSGEIRHAFGLDTLSVQGGKALKDSSLLLGKYLTPDLYVSYALGLFDRTASLRFRYKLNRRLSVEGQSGQQQGLDLIYRIERKQLF